MEGLVAVVETHAFQQAAKGIFSTDELDELIVVLADNPEIGSVIVGGSGIRKIRVAAKR